MQSGAYAVWRLCSLTRRALFDLLAIGLFTRLDRIVQSFLLATDDVTALVDQIGRIVAKFRTLLPEVIRAFVRLVSDHAAGFFAGLRCKQHAKANAHSQTQKKIR